MKTVREAIEAELKRQYEASGPYGQLHYLSFGEDGRVQLEGGVDLEQLSLAIRRHRLADEYVALVGYDPFVDDPTITVEQVEELIAGVTAEALLAGHEVKVFGTTTAQRMELMAEWAKRRMED